MKKIILFVLVCGNLLCFNSGMLAQTPGEANGYQTVVKVVSNRLETKVENYTTWYRNCVKSSYNCTGSGDLSCPTGNEESCGLWSPNVG